jgi:hypothetical protein
MEWLASHPGRFIPEENAPDTYLLRGCSVPHRRSKRFGERNIVQLVGWSLYQLSYYEYHQGKTFTCINDNPSKWTGYKKQRQQQLLWINSNNKFWACKKVSKHQFNSLQSDSLKPVLHMSWFHETFRYRLMGLQTNRTVNADFQPKRYHSFFEQFSVAPKPHIFILDQQIFRILTRAFHGFSQF